ncbi:uncharacterized protein LOC106093824 [Stomoxys calcitrans]|uniref:uncharacterized protein LOC106093824 n=1 Tax=Stomoxys calcitrans TaxID=35570 RepID=UPI0027E37086|nr:uncharacterized protein LOC106093824 [Stomoxys calcitrans]XP_059227064.1 uncharacterized protein LOC106093824 [Stomoxys calcitrans]
MKEAVNRNSAKLAANTKEMAFTRHQIDKRRLIELVKLNPILWDCRLPHYKRSDKKKALKWNELGRIFSVNGERVQRTFTSLREIFRRELNHEKMLGSRFKSKWEYYDEMSFLKEVIRERKSRERAKSNDGHAASVTNNNNNSTTGIDEYQYFAPNDPNNPQNQPMPLVAANPPTQPCSLVVPTPTNLPPQNGASTPQIPNNPPNTPVSSLSGSHIPNDVILNLNPSTLAALQKLNACNNNNNSNIQPSLRPISRSRSMTIRSGSSSPTIYIKDEPDSLDDTISLDTTSNGKVATKEHHRPLAKTKSQDHKFNAESKNLNNSTQNLVIDERDCSDIDDDPDVDMLDDDRLSISTSLVSLQKDSTANAKTSQRLHQQQQQLLKPTAHEILYAKFGEFLAARLNTLNETMANELMNKILMLIAEK